VTLLGRAAALLAAFVELCRPVNVAIAACAILLGAQFSHAPLAGALVLTDVLELLPAACLLLAAGYAWNDVQDVARDRVSHPRRPLAAGRVPMRAARAFAFALFAAGVLLALRAPDREARALLLAWAALLLAYRAIADRAPALKAVVASALTASAVLLGALPGPRPAAAIPAALLALLLTWLREMVKDLADRAGDRAAGSPSWIDSLPPARARGALVGAAGLLLALTPLPAIFLGYGLPYLAVALAAVAATVLPLVAAGEPADPGDPGRWRALSVRLKASMAGGLVALFLAVRTL
jgi:4-hydroxybenzoate polyprenyltransferase